MKVDLWVVLIWPVVVYIVCSILLALARAVRRRASPVVASWRSARRRRRHDRFKEERLRKYMAGQDPTTIEGLTIGDLIDGRRRKGEQPDTPP